jgi:hypothetical protein
MSKTELKIVEGGEQAEPTAQELPEQQEEFTEELPALHIDPTSFDARMAGVESCSVARELSKHWSVVAAYELEQEQLHGAIETPEEPWKAEQALRERKRELWRRKWEPKSEEALEDHIQYIKRKAARYIDWGDLGQLWNSAPRDAIELWKAIRLEARDEFVSGHYGARAFESADYMYEAFKRAQSRQLSGLPTCSYCSRRRTAFPASILAASRVEVAADNPTTRIVRMECLVRARNSVV